MSVTLPFEQQPISIYASGLDGDGTFLDLIAVVDDYATLRFTHGSYQPGDFEITINKNTNYAQLFTRQRLIQIGTNEYKCGVIESVQDEVGPEGALSEKITVKGREVWSYLDRRIVIPPAGEAYYALSASTPVETVIKTLVDSEMGPGATANREDTNLTIEADTGLGDDYVLSARYDNLLTLIGNACLATNSGVFSYLDHTNKKWVFGFTLGLDRTTGQTTNPQAVFSTDRDTVNKSVLKNVDQGYRNLAVVGGQGEGAARTIVTVPASEPTGRARREMFVDARDLTLTASLENRGNQKLAENGFTKFISSDVLAYSQLVYGQDYNVVDEVTIEEFGLTQDAFITSAEEYWANGNYNLKIGFDRSSPTLPSQVSQIYSQVSKALNANESPPSLTSLLARSIYQGLIMSYVSTTSFSVATGGVGDSTFADVMMLAATTTKTTSSWAAGTGNGGLDTGSIGASSWYYVYLIKRPDTGVVDVLFSLSSSAPTMPSNYTLKRMIGAVLTNGSSQFVDFIMYADGTQAWKTLSLDINDSTLTTTRKTYTVARVPAVKSRVSFNAEISCASIAAVYVVGDSSITDVAPSLATNSTTIRMHVSATACAFKMADFIMTGQSLYARSDTASTTMQWSVLSFNIRPFN